MVLEQISLYRLSTKKKADGSPMSFNNTRRKPKTRKPATDKKPDQKLVNCFAINPSVAQWMRSSTNTCLSSRGHVHSRGWGQGQVLGRGQGQVLGKRHVGVLGRDRGQVRSNPGQSLPTLDRQSWEGTQSPVRLLEGTLLLQSRSCSGSLRQQGPGGRCSP